MGNGWIKTLILNDDSWNSYDKPFDGCYNFLKQLIWTIK